MVRDISHRGEYLYIYNEARKPEQLLRDTEDLNRFVKTLHYLNDAATPRNWERDISQEHIEDNYARPEHWGAALPLVSLVSFQINEHNFTMLVRAEEDRGVERYMQKIGTSIASYYNTKYGHEGSIFEGAYRAAKISRREHLEYLAVKLALEAREARLRYERHVERLNRAFDKLQDLIQSGRYRMDDELVDLLLDLYS